jgi:hypothetical protein
MSGTISFRFKQMQCVLSLVLLFHITVENPPKRSKDMTSKAQSLGATQLIPRLFGSNNHVQSNFPLLPILVFNKKYSLFDQNKNVLTDVL